MKLELIEVDCDRKRFGIFPHFFHPQNLVEITGDFVRAGSHLKSVTVHTVTEHIICLKWRQSQNGTVET